MTVMDAPRTGELEVGTVVSETPKTDAIVAKIAEPVWELLTADELRPEDRLQSALALLRAKAPAFEQAWREEYVGLPAAPPAEPTKPARNCISFSHALLSCPQALAEGVLPEGEPFCRPCSDEQLALAATPAVEEAPAVEGRIVHVVTTAPTQPIRKAG